MKTFFITLMFAVFVEAQTDIDIKPGSDLDKLLRVVKTTASKADVEKFDGKLPFNAQFDLCNSEGYFNTEQVKKLGQVLSEITYNSINSRPPDFAFYRGTSGAPFNGSFDWHSSIHAHWMILSIARLTGDKTYSSKILPTLTNESIARIGSLIDGFEIRFKKTMDIYKSGSAWPDESSEDGKKFFEEIGSELQYRYVSAWGLFLHKELEYVGFNKGILDKNRQIFLHSMGTRYDNSHSHGSSDFGIYSMKLNGINSHPSLTYLLEQQKSTNVSTGDQDALFYPLLLRLLSKNGKVQQSAVFPLVKRELKSETGHLFGKEMTTSWVKLSTFQSVTDRLKVCKKTESKINYLLSHPTLSKYNKKELHMFFTHWVPQYIWLSIHVSMDPDIRL